jgi:hypothetical protein
MARTTLATIFLMLACGATARGQDSGRVGLTMGYPASIGVIWQVSDRVAVRPELSFTDSTSESTSVLTIFGSGGVTTTTTQRSTTDSTTIGTGASLLYYAGRWESLRTYLSPRFGYTRNTSSTTPPSAIAAVTGGPANTEFTSTSYFVSGSFGAQYGLGRRFGIFGELGFGYSHIKSQNNLSLAGNGSGRSVSTRSGAGVIVFF